jgi:hypothetical protein
VARDTECHEPGLLLSGFEGPIWVPAYKMGSAPGGVDLHGHSQLRISHDAGISAPRGREISSLLRMRIVEPARHFLCIRFVVLL